MKAMYVNDIEVKEIDFNDELEEMYDLLDCRCIDIVTRKIGDKYYCVVVDDEGLFAMNPRPSAIDKMQDVMLVGNLIIANDGGENLAGITPDDVKNIYDHTYTAFYNKGLSPVVEMDY